MALGDQSKALILMSINKGWNPTIIPARDDKPEESIANFNKAPNPWELGAQSVGQLPEGLHDSYRQAEEPRFQEGTLTDDRITWNAPDHTRETVNRATKNGKEK